MRIAVDVGGTFTDVVVLGDDHEGLRHEKVETVPSDPASGVIAGFAKADAALGSLDFFVHGTTLGINALLTRTGARVAIVTTLGFRDVYEVGRTDREPMYDFKYRRPETLVPRRLVFEVAERVTHDGTALVPFDRESAVAAARRVREQGADAVAVCFLHSYANPAHELAMEEVLREECPEVSVTLSHRLSREYREYERTSTAVIDAYVKPITTTYLETLEGNLERGEFGGHFLLTRSGGGAMTVASAKEQPVHLVLSGPAGGVIGAAALGKILGHDNLITIDMGGTSLDASLIAGGHAKIETEQQFETLPVSIPTIDIHTIGAGGGSIAWVDEGGHLQVGPKSAGAVPGPACYAKGGDQATFTDAALAVGYLDPTNFLGGEIPLDAELTKQAIAKLADGLGISEAATAAGILRITNAKIAGAVRVISIERGYHPKDFSILGFGGAGAFVAAEVARELAIPTTIIPPGPATFSAFGMLMTDVVNDFGRTAIVPLEAASIEAANEVFAHLAELGTDALNADGFPEKDWLFLPSAEMRYQGQEHTVNVPLSTHTLKADDFAGILEQFGAVHHQQYGHHMDDPVEIVTLRLRTVGLLPRPEIPKIAVGDGNAEGARVGSRSVYRAELGGQADYAVYDRVKLRSSDSLEGPAIIEEPSSTTVIHDGDVLTVGEHGELVINRTGS
ncbi:MAG: N-methylhydantoinase [Gaiellaceae bacterium]|nr:N-methylhydantoinase [Gaiellaceae bacterium]